MKKTISPRKNIDFGLDFGHKNPQKIGGYDDDIFQLITHDLAPRFTVGSGFFGVHLWVAVTSTR